MKNNSFDLIQDVLSHDLKSDIMKILKEHDFYTFNHSRDVAFMTAIFLSNDYFSSLTFVEKYDILRGALFHDIGKIFIPYSILNKQGNLSETEMNIIRTHCLKGKDFCVQNNIKEQNVLKCISQHHERLDGSGYPNHLKNNEIYIGAKIIGLIDVFDALRSYRSYKTKYSEYKVSQYFLSELNNNLFDKDLLQILLSENMMNDLYTVKKRVIL